MATGGWTLLTSGSKSFNIPALTGCLRLHQRRRQPRSLLPAAQSPHGLSSPAVLAVAAHVGRHRHGEPRLDSLRDYLQDNLTYVAERLEQAFPARQLAPAAGHLRHGSIQRPLAVDDRAAQQALIERERWRSCRALLCL